MKWFKVLERSSQIGEGEVMEVHAGNRKLAVSKVDGVICALDGVCAHEGGPLGKGSIKNGHIICPWHGWEFDSCSGQYLYNSAKGVESFPVEVREGGVYVGV